MILQTTIKSRAYASKAGFARLDERLEEHRRLYNAALEHRRTAYKRAGVSVGLYAQTGELKEVRSDDPDGWGAEARRVQVGTLERVDRAYKAFFKRGGFPRFKGKGRFRTLEMHSGAERYLRSYNDETGKGAIRIKGLPTIRFRDKRVPVDADGKPVHPKRILITRTANLLHVCMSFDAGDKPKVGDKPPKRPVGIDVGVNKRAALSTGERVPTRRKKTSRRWQRKMARQRRQAVKDGRANWQPKRGGGVRLVWNAGEPSGGYLKARTRHAAALLRERTANRQNLHRLAAAIVQRYDFIAVEDLQTQNMTRSARGTIESPGKGVAQKRGLNRSILEQTWGEFTTILAGKAERAGARFVKVDPKFTSQTCSTCGAADKRSRRGETFDCVHCGYLADADMNAAVNIRERGLELAGFSLDRKSPERDGRRGAIQNPEPGSDRAESATALLQPALFAFGST